MTGPGVDSERFKRLPEPVPYDEMVSTHDTGPLPDPSAERDTERDFMLRYAG